ncbi:hypothetical protein SAMN06265171_105116 [Chryseobacterium rhizoplanae]|uniref:Uncharacterized protein n=1 Tax=Chryseobacterium rhizoplanae TaxID=1609531 RepID=A0A521DIA4_9FLAO|nr:hypothetical protein [Chryseobacterium rhizoplanae]SMO70871.1 hypothetical protein SAMN06265171_105116 [Chryseobacterium rhizoplanae]
MKRAFIVYMLFALFFCKAQNYTETEILDQLDLAFNGKPSKYFPQKKSKEIHYNFFLDLEHGYFMTAGNRIHLYGDGEQWAIVFEKNGYQNRATRAEIELNYIGNCINYSIEKYSEINYISNTNYIVLIDSNEFERIENKGGSGLETFEHIGEQIKEIKIRNQFVPFNNNYRDYEKVGITIENFDKDRKLIGFGDLIRYYNEVNPTLLYASEDEIKMHIPKKLKKIITIDKFNYNRTILPSKQDTYKMIAKVLVSRNSFYWNPTLPFNNHWSHWESGNL